jgi:putative flippase GtrA
VKKRILPFAMAGTIGFVVDAGILLLLAPLLGPFGGRVLSFAAAVLATWLINRNFAFADKAASSGKGREFLRYFGAMLPGAAVNWVAYGLVIALLADTNIGLVLAVAAGSLSGMATNLVAADRLAFRDRR